MSCEKKKTKFCILFAIILIPILITLAVVFRNKNNNDNDPNNNNGNFHAVHKINDINVNFDINSLTQEKKITTLNFNNKDCLTGLFLNYSLVNNADSFLLNNSLLVDNSNGKFIDEKSIIDVGFNFRSQTTNLYDSSKTHSFYLFNQVYDTNVTLFEGNYNAVVKSQTNKNNRKINERHKL